MTYDCPEEATDATSKMDGTTIFGQQIKVNVARPKNNDGGGYRSGGGRGDYQQSRGRGRGRGGGGSLSFLGILKLVFLIDRNKSSDLS